MLDDGGCITYYMVTHDMCSHMCLVYRKSHLMWCKFLECILYIWILNQLSHVQFFLQIVMGILQVSHNIILLIIKYCLTNLTFS